MFGATFNLVTCVGTLTDGTLEINSLALNNYFIYKKNVFQIGANALLKMVRKTGFLSEKLKISCNLDHTILFKFH